MKKYWISLLIGCIPFLVALSMGLYNSIVGFSGLSFHNKNYGFDAFFDTIVLVSYLIYPLYIIGLFLIIFSIVKLRRKK